MASELSFFDEKSQRFLTNKREFTDFLAVNDVDR